jgi:hypothetical protein
MLDWRTKDGFKPTRSFTVGEQVRVGLHDNSEIINVIDECAYTVRCKGVRTNHGVDVPYEQTSDFNWHDIFKMSARSSNLTKPEKFYISYQNRCVSGLLSLIIADYAGMDFNPEYQRELVWNIDDKVKLIDSIFNHRPIGAFVIAENHDTEKRYEIIDGKQRLSALVDFYEDRFQYEGFYFSELSRNDAIHFEDYQVLVGIMQNPTLEQKLQAFLSVNVTGIKVCNTVIENAKILLDATRSKV